MGLLKLPIPSLLPSQLKLFNKKNLQAKKAYQLGKVSLLKILERNEGKEVLAVDIGGDKLWITTFQVRNKKFHPVDLTRIRSDQGKGYLRQLEKKAKKVRKNHISVGIAYAMLVSGTKPEAKAKKFKAFLQDLKKYNGDFSNLFGEETVLLNDAVAGTIGGVFEDQKKHKKLRNLIFIVNGSGIGGAVFKDGIVYSNEPGDVKVVEELNPEKQNKACEYLGYKETCLELVGASKVGIEDLWFKKTGRKLQGEDISSLYQAGDKLALRLYANSALIVAHAIKGLGQVYELFDENSPPAVVCHGGIFHVPGYGERVGQILEKDLGYKLDILLTKDFEEYGLDRPNPGLVGAALAALIMGQENS